MSVLNKYLLPWKEAHAQRDMIVAFVRTSLNGHNMWGVYLRGSKWVCHVSCPDNTGPYDTAIEAMYCMDKMLLKNGYIFISEERAEKLRLLA